MGEQTFFGPAGGYDGIDAAGDENLGISKVRRDAEDRNTVGFKFFHIRLSQTSESQADGRHLQFNNFPELIIKKRSRYRSSCRASQILSERRERCILQAKFLGV